MPVSERMAAHIVHIQDNFALLSKWIEGLDTMLDVEMIEGHLNTLKEVLLFSFYFLCFYYLFQNVTVVRVNMLFLVNASLSLLFFLIYSIISLIFYLFATNNKSITSQKE